MNNLSILEGLETKKKKLIDDRYIIKDINQECKYDSFINNDRIKFKLILRKNALIKRLNNLRINTNI